MSNYVLFDISDYICIFQDKSYSPNIQKLRLLMTINPIYINFYDMNLKEKLKKKIFPNEHVGKLLYLFDQRIIFDIWWKMSISEKKELYQKNSFDSTDLASPWDLETFSRTLKKPTSMQRLASLLSDSWSYPIGSLKGIKQQSPSGEIFEDYWEFTAMPLESNNDTGYLYLYSESKFGLNPSRMFLRNDVNHQMPTIWQTMYELWSNESEKKGFFLGGSCRPNFELKDIKMLRKNLVTKAEVSAYIIQQNTRIVEGYIDTDNYRKEQFLKNKQERRVSQINLVTPQNENVLSNVNTFLKIKYEELNKRLTTDINIARAKWNEHSYQELLLEIFPFIFPQYTHFIREYHFSIDHNSMKKEDIPDFLAATANFSLDILEIKTPYFNLFNKTRYRSNYVFSHEVQGLITQTQKYIYNLERNAIREEANITKCFREKANFSGGSLHIRSPKAIVVIGRTPVNDLNEEVIRDLEVSKRKYQDIADFLTYDDVLKRMGQIINRQQVNIEYW